MHNELSKNIAPEKLATRYWAIAIPLLVLALLSGGFGYGAVLALTAIQGAHFAWRERSVLAFPVQVRGAYFLLVLMSLSPYMQWILWALLVGTAIRVTFNYCFLARTMVLLPWNRHQFLTWELIRWIYLMPVTRGSILRQIQAAR